MDVEPAVLPVKQKGLKAHVSAVCFSRVLPKPVQNYGRNSS